jgi:tetratricopeptide (TPR) repeat protein/SAM-dependent methyltransferase
MALPLAGKLRILAPSGVGRGVGSAYAVNTLGAILGTALTGFVLLPLLGRIWKLLYLAAGLGLLAGIVVVLAAPGRRRGLRYSILGLLVALCLSLAYLTRPHGVLDSPGENRVYWHPAVFSFGGYINLANSLKFKTPERYSRAMINSFEPLYFRDGEAASVAVIRNRSQNTISLRISGKADASAGEVDYDAQTQLLMGHLPILLHPGPRRALNLGLGSGMSLGAMTLYPGVEEIDLLELCPEVEEAARLYFGEENHGALTNPRVHRVIGDGRNHLTHTRRTYDVISSEPSNFWIAGLGNLFTEEFYRLALRRLNPGGIIWANDNGDTILLGSMEPLVIDRDRIARALANEGVREELSLIGIQEPEDLFRYFRCEGSRLLDWVAEGPTNSDLFPILEYSSPLGFYGTASEISLNLSRAAAATGEWPPELLRGFSPENRARIEAIRGQAQILSRLCEAINTGHLARALKDYETLAREGNRAMLDFAARQFIDLAKTTPKSGPLLRAARKAHDTPELCMADGFLPGPSGDRKAQLQAYRKLASESPANRWEPYLGLAVIEAQENQFDRAHESLEIARERGMPAFKLHQVRGILAGMQGDLPGAEALLRESLARTPAIAEADSGQTAWNLGFCLKMQEKYGEAAEAYRMAKEFGYHQVDCSLAAGRCLRMKGDLKGALKELEGIQTAADRMGPDASGQVMAEIARVHAAAGELDRAIRWMDLAEQFSPGRYRKELNDLRARAGKKR